MNPISRFHQINAIEKGIIVTGIIFLCSEVLLAFAP
jgi:hypothetical protein